MAQIIHFKNRKEIQEEQELQRYLKISDDFDAIISEHINDGRDLLEVAAVLAHRLGNLLRHADEDCQQQAIEAMMNIITKRVEQVQTP